MGTFRNKKLNIPSIALASMTTAIMGYVVCLFARETGLESLSFAFWINWILMLWAYLIHRTGAVNFPQGYFEIRPFEKEIYCLLGVRYYQRLLRRISIFNPQLHLGGGRGDLVRLEKAMRGAEQAHAMIFVIVSVFMLYALFRGWWATAFWYFLFNMLFNGYPVMVQRFNRSRTNRLVGMMHDFTR